MWRRGGRRESGGEEEAAEKRWESTLEEGMQRQRHWQWHHELAMTTTVVVAVLDARRGLANTFYFSFFLFFNAELYRLHCYFKVYLFIYFELDQATQNRGGPCPDQYILSGLYCFRWYDNP